MALFRTFLLMSSLTSNMQRLGFPAARTASRLPHSSLHHRDMSTFKLDANLFNATLYRQLTNVWLPGVDLRGEELDMSVLKRWFMAGPDERAAFDGLCRDKFAPALEAIGPGQMTQPTAQPFLDEIERVAQNDPMGDGAEAAWTALSLTLLLDQIPRNLYRTDAGLHTVYTHYDIMSYNLSRALLSSKSPVPRVDLHAQWRNSAAHRLWFYMPLMHSEDIEAHHAIDEILGQASREVNALEGHHGTKTFLDGQLQAEKSHREILDRFGRYPHRNGALGRQSTEEEIKFLEGGGATFGVTQEKKKSTT
jgi:uncharacterized protein (DUF924 family)